MASADGVSGGAAEERLGVGDKLCAAVVAGGRGEEVGSAASRLRPSAALTICTSSGDSRDEALLTNRPASVRQRTTAFASTPSSFAISYTRSEAMP